MVNENINILETPVPHIKGENLLKPTKYTSDRPKEPTQASASQAKWSKNTGNRAKRAENVKKKIIRIFDQFKRRPGRLKKKNQSWL